MECVWLFWARRENDIFVCFYHWIIELVYRVYCFDAITPFYSLAFFTKISFNFLFIYSRLIFQIKICFPKSNRFVLVNVKNITCSTITFMKREVPKTNAHFAHNFSILLCAFIESRNNFNRSSSFVFFKYLQAVQVLFNHSSIVSSRFSSTYSFSRSIDSIIIAATTFWFLTSDGVTDTWLIFQVKTSLTLPSLFRRYLLLELFAMTLRLKWKDWF